MSSSTYLIWSYIVVSVSVGIAIFSLYKNSKITCSLFVLVLAFATITTINSNARNKERLLRAVLHYERNLTNSTILDVNSIADGLYYNLGSYRGSDGNWLTIIQAAEITFIDRTNRIVLSIRTDDKTSLVSAPQPLMSHRFLNRSPSTGFVRIGSDDNVNKTIEDFNPFQ